MGRTINVTFLHPTNGQDMEVEIDDSMTASAVICLVPYWNFGMIVEGLPQASYVTIKKIYRFCASWACIICSLMEMTSSYRFLQEGIPIIRLSDSNSDMKMRLI